jgi:outer membrane protein assembly factor BamB
MCINEEEMVMRKTLAGVVVVVLGLVSACGGAGSDPVDGASARATASARTRSDLVVQPASIDLATAYDLPIGLRLSADYPTRSSKPSYLNVAPVDPIFDANPVVTPLGNGRYTVALVTARQAAVGDYSGAVTLRMCSEVPCVNVIAGSTTTVPYRVRIDRPALIVPEWQTFQGNAGHTGFVPVTLDPTKFAKAWEWRRTSTGVLGFINAVATENGKVFVTDDEYFGSLTSLYALNEADGTLAWRQDFINAPALNPPAAANGVVYAATTGHSDTFLWAFKASDGSLMFKSAFDGQWPHVLAPTVRDNRVFTNGGYFGGGTYALDAQTGARQWAQFAGDDDMSTPAESFPIQV